MRNCTSSANFLLEVAFVHNQLTKVLGCRIHPNSYRNVLSNSAEVLQHACEDFGKGPACDTYQNSYEQACDALHLPSTQNVSRRPAVRQPSLTFSEWQFVTKAQRAAMRLVEAGQTAI